MRGREPVLPKRRRRIPPQFSWVDHRLVRDGHISGRSAEALALYLFLVTVADADGLSWYSETALCRMMSWELPGLRQARNELRSAELIAFRKPLYQVLDLSPLTTVPTRPQRSGGGEAMAIGDILTGLMSGGAQ
ncbi:hypothetical protein ACFLQU_05900 [Verrucomicrobiota bacterium]